MEIRYTGMARKAKRQENAEKQKTSEPELGIAKKRGALPRPEEERETAC
jgi:hypothetical protein